MRGGRSCALLRGDSRLADVGARIAAAEDAAVPDPAGEADALRLAAAAGLTSGTADGLLALLDRAVDLGRAHGSALVEAEPRRTRAEALVRRSDPARPRRRRGGAPHLRAAGRGGGAPRDGGAAAEALLRTLGDAGAPFGDQ